MVKMMEKMWENIITDIGMYNKTEWTKQEIKS